jgi:hypothetical protein
MFRKTDRNIASDKASRTRWRLALVSATALISALLMDQISSRTSVMSLSVILMLVGSIDTLDREIG